MIKVMKMAHGEQEKIKKMKTFHRVPPWASSRPLSCELANEIPKARERVVMMAALPMMREASIADIFGASFTIIAT